MKREHADPHSKAVVDAAIAHIESMSAEDALGFLTNRPPDVEETDMTGMFAAPKRGVRRPRNTRALDRTDRVVSR
jgi:hypothetical protein